MYIRLPGLNSLDDIPSNNTYGDSFPAYQLNVDNDLITVSDFELIPSETSYPSVLEEITFTEPNIVQLTSSQSFYCYLDNELRRISTIATYKKL